MQSTNIVRGKEIRNYAYLKLEVQHYLIVKTFAHKTDSLKSNYYFLPFEWLQFYCKPVV